MNSTCFGYFQLIFNILVCQQYMRYHKDKCNFPHRSQPIIFNYGVIWSYYICIFIQTVECVYLLSFWPLLYTHTKVLHIQHFDTIWRKLDNTFLSLPQRSDSDAELKCNFSINIDFVQSLLREEAFQCIGGYFKQTGCKYCITTSLGRIFLHNHFG